MHAHTFRERGARNFCIKLSSLLLRTRNGVPEIQCTKRLTLTLARLSVSDFIHRAVGCACIWYCMCACVGNV